MSSLTAVTAKMVQKFRASSGLPLMECKQLLAEADGDHALAAQLARQRGLKPSDGPPGDRPGYVGVYRHHNGRVGAMVTLRCDSDSLAKTEEFRALADSIAMHVAAVDPRYVGRSDIPLAALATMCAEIESEAKDAVEGKPEEVRKRVLNGKLQTRLGLVCLLEQPFVRPDADNKIVTVASMLDGLSARGRERVEVESFRRFKV